MGLYARWLHPRLMDRSMRRHGELRRRVLAAAAGEVLEVGFGTGLNLPHYPAAVRSLAAVDPLDALRERVARRISDAPFPVRLVQLSADGGLPFDDASFDCVVTTWTLCAIPDAVAALREMRRVLRPAGRYLFIEHGLSEHPVTARWQRRLDSLHLRVSRCHLDRPIEALVREAGFEILALERFVEAGGPRIWSEMYRGLATP
jgi:ubiquinone/menaquinone biosynthesis C-methylase UbiE